MKISDSNNMRFALLHSIFAAFLFFLAADQCPAQPKEQITNDVPIHVTSDKMVAQKEKLMVEFTGNAKATRQDTILTADAIKIFFFDNKEKKDDSAQGSIKKIVSTGNVEYTDKDRKANADMAVYTTEDDVLVLTGNSPRVTTGESFVTGKKITLFRQQDKVIVESGGENRVEALFTPDKNLSEKP